jgi:hypothetical protein
LADSKKIQELEARIEKMAAQQEFLHSRIEALIQVIEASLQEKKEPDPICGCGFPLHRVLGTWPQVQTYWECTHCGNTVFPT